MSKHYQYKRLNKYMLPHNVHMQVTYIIKDYTRLLEEEYNIIHNTPVRDGTPRGTDIPKPTEAKAAKLEKISEQIRAIDQTCIEMIGAYSDRAETFNALDAFHNFAYFSSKLGKSIGYSERTWKYYRQKFIYKVAQRLKII